MERKIKRPFMCGDTPSVYIPSDGCVCDYVMVRQDEEGYTAVYYLMRGDKPQGDRIEIPEYDTEELTILEQGEPVTVSVVKSWTANTPTAVSPKTVVTGGTKSSIPNVASKTVVTGVTKKTVVTSVTKKTVVTSVSPATVVTSVSPETVVKSASGATAKIEHLCLTITDGSFQTGAAATVQTGSAATVQTGDSVDVTTGDSVEVTTGDSVTTGSPIQAYTSLNTGDSVTVTPGTAATLETEEVSIPTLEASTVEVMVMPSDVAIVDEAIVDVSVVG